MGAVIPRVRNMDFLFVTCLARYNVTPKRGEKKALKEIMMKCELENNPLFTTVIPNIN